MGMQDYSDTKQVVDPAHNVTSDEYEVTPNLQIVEVEKYTPVKNHPKKSCQDELFKRHKDATCTMHTSKRGFKQLHSPENTNRKHGGGDIPWGERRGTPLHQQAADGA